MVCGIDDSNAAGPLRFLMDREREAFHGGVEWHMDDPLWRPGATCGACAKKRDMLANVNVFGAPIATARYMGGRETEVISQGVGDPPSMH